MPYFIEEPISKEKARDIVSTLSARLNMEEPILIVTDDEGTFFQLTDHSPKEILAHYDNITLTNIDVLREDIVNKSLVTGKSGFVEGSRIVIWEHDLGREPVFHEITHHWLHETGWYTGSVMVKRTLCEIVVRDWAEELRKCYEEKIGCKELKVGVKEWVE